MIGLTEVNWSFIAFIGMVLFILAFMLIVPQILGGRSTARAKHQPFESGIVGAGGARVRLSAKFYLVAIFFVLFDIEALYLYAWAVSAKEVGWMGYAEVVIFVSVLLVGLIYIIRIGGLDWSPKDRKSLHVMNLPKGFAKGTAIDLSAVTAFNGVEELERDPLGKVPAQLSGVMNTPAKAQPVTNSTTTQA